MVDESLMRDFVAEGRDMLDEVEPRLIELQQVVEETGAVDLEIINNVFRLFHSMKGSAGFLGLSNVSSVTHEAETLLDMFRKERATLQRDHTALLCRALDFVHVMLDEIEASSNDQACTAAAADLVAALKTSIAATVAQGKQAAAAPRPSPAEAPAAPAPAVVSVQPAPPAAPAELDVPAPADLQFVLEVTPEMRERFAQEAIELLEKAEQALLGLEASGNDESADLLAEAFRAIHSIKGNAGFMGLGDLERLSHRSETVLAGMRDGQVERSANNVQTLLNILDVLGDAVADVIRGGEGAIGGCDVLMELVSEMIPPQEQAALPAAPTTPAPTLAPPPEQKAPPSPKPQTADDNAQREDAGDGREQADRPLAERGGARREVQRRDIRVDLDKLDLLINLVGELVIAEAMVTGNPDLRGLELENFERASHHLRRITTELQDVAMAVRMIPLSATFRKMIRLVHDVAGKAGKKARLQLVGEETEVDKTVIELIGDPLVHIVRNSVDHGLEPPQERARLGKDESGTITIEGRHEGGEVWIMVSDDGRGLNRDRILARGIERGLVQGDGSDLRDDDIYKLIFEPGFSTAEKITDVSGRGVGMDVVKKNVDKLKGRVDIRSRPGRGTTIVLRIPLTLAIIEGMLVRVGNARYTIPLLNIRESLRTEGHRVTRTMDGQELIRVREDLIPILRLHERFRKEPYSERLEDGVLVVIEEGGQLVAVLVDEIVGQQQTVIKGLSDYMGDAAGVSGCTILGDGQISLILNVSDLVAAVADLRQEA